eukprot:scaffold132387_cov69-Phaeocystis_antarctica.AAC.1
MIETVGASPGGGASCPPAASALLVGGVHPSTKPSTEEPRTHGGGVVARREWKCTGAGRRQAGSRCQSARSIQAGRGRGRRSSPVASLVASCRRRRASAAVPPPPSPFPSPSPSSSSSPESSSSSSSSELQPGPALRLGVRGRVVAARALERLAGQLLRVAEELLAQHEVEPAGACRLGELPGIEIERDAEGGGEGLVRPLRGEPARVRPVDRDRERVLLGVEQVQLVREVDRLAVAPIGPEQPKLQVDQPGVVAQVERVQIEAQETGPLALALVGQDEQLVSAPRAVAKRERARQLGQRHCTLDALAIRQPKGGEVAQDERRPGQRLGADGTVVLGRQLARGCAEKRR